VAGRLGRPPFSYRPGNSVFHRFPAGLKLLGLLALSTFAFASPAGLVFSIALLTVACAVARIPPGGLLRGSKPIMVLALAIVLVRTVGNGEAGVEGFREGLVAALRILVVFTSAGFLFAVTTMRELRLSLAKLENGVKNVFSARRGKRGGIAFFSLGISLMLGFTPRFFDAWETANLACRARSCRSGPRRLFVLVPLVTERMMEAAAETVLALEARGLGNE